MKLEMKTLHFSLFLGLLPLTCFSFAAGPPPAKVVVEEVVQKEISETAPFIGVFYYERLSQISSEVPGLVKSIHVTEGERIKKGRVIVELDTEILDQNILFTKTQIQQAKLKIEKAQKKYERFKKLHQEKNVSDQSYDDALYQLKESQLEKQLAEIEWSGLQIKKRKSKIVAPFDSIVLEKNVDQGDWIQQGKPLVKLGSEQDLMVNAAISEKYLPYISKGEQVALNIHAYNKKIKGYIQSIGPVADAITKNLTLKIRVPLLKDVVENMSVKVQVPVSFKKKMSVFSRDAIVQSQGKNYVYQIKDGKAAMLPVQISAYLGEMVGSTAGDLKGISVVVEGNERLRPGQSVLIEK